MSDRYDPQRATPPYTGPPPLPGFHYGGPPPQRKSRRWIWLVAVGVLVVLAVVVVIVLSTTGNDDRSARASGKPDIMALDQDMLIPQSAFPAPSGGKFRLTPVRTNKAASSPGSGSCDLNARLFRGKFQETTAYFTYEGSSLRYNIELFRTEGKPDLRGWARDCLPSEDYGKRVEVAGLPPWAIAFGDGNRLVALGYYRGVIVEAFIRETPSSPDAESELADMFNKQIARLEAQ